jgi:hypothetical protein
MLGLMLAIALGVPLSMVIREWLIIILFKTFSNSSALVAKFMLQ